MRVRAFRKTILNFDLDLVAGAGADEDDVLADLLFAGRVGDLDVEVYCDLGFRFDALAVLYVGLEVPFADGLLRGGGQNRRAAQHMQVFDDAVGANQSLKNDRSLDIHALGQQRIRRGRS